ncbi:MAG: hypothetical protein J2P19_26955, partial [Pseudonocardia sp.]|nr:hypothetical protein [Pseudonocardia sp.]
MPAVEGRASEARTAGRLRGVKRPSVELGVGPGGLSGCHVGRFRQVKDLPGLPAHALLDRRDECTVLDELLDVVRAGESRSLVIAGEPGV